MDDDKSEPGNPAHSEVSPTDVALADRTARAVLALQEAMDTALLAGLIIEPNFTQVENRLTRYGTRIESFVCSLRVYRKLT